jgi:hypothetical protein
MCRPQAAAASVAVTGITHDGFAAEDPGLVPVETRSLLPKTAVLPSPQACGGSPEVPASASPPGWRGPLPAALYRPRMWPLEPVIRKAAICSRHRCEAAHSR